MGAHRQTFSLMLLVAVGSAVLFYFGREHWAHIFGFLPYALFLACPLMHLFMHHGHGHGHGHRERSMPNNSGSFSAPRSHR
jgi:hypothetical protein